MYDIIENVIRSHRTDERSSILMGLVDILDNMGYTDSLLSALNVTTQATDTDSMLDGIEHLVISNSIDLLSRLGITVSDLITDDIVFLFSILKWSTEDIDDTELVDELLDIMNSGEPDTIIITDITAVFSGLDHSSSASHIEYVEPRFIKYISNNLTARKGQELDEVSEVSIVDARMHAYLISLPLGSPVRDQLSSGGYTRAMNEFISTIDIDYDDLTADELIPLYVNLIVGIQLAYVDNYDDALDTLDVIMLVVREEHLSLVMRISSGISNALTKSLYEVLE